MNIALYPVVQT